MPPQDWQTKEALLSMRLLPLPLREGARSVATRGRGRRVVTPPPIVFRIAQDDCPLPQGEGKEESSASGLSHDSSLAQRSSGQRGFESCQFRWDFTIGHSSAVML